MLTVKYPSEVNWNKASGGGSGGGSSGGGDGGGEGQGGEGCDADVTVCATNRLAGPGEDAKVNFTFEVRDTASPGESWGG